MPALRVGDAAPDFHAQDQLGRPVHLASLRGRPVVLFFYPKDRTPACTAQVCAFRDAEADLTRAGAAVIGISSDSGQSHAAVSQRHNLPYPLVSDPEGRLRSLFRVPRSIFGLFPGRVTFVLDARGAVRLIYNSQFRPSEHARRALEAVKALGDQG